jgi:hypothetical protein
MPTNFYFNNFPSSQVTSEQLLVEDLVIESMQIHGMDVLYMPRTSRDSVDYLFGEDTLKTYTSAHNIEMYLENVTGMDGEGDFISKFGLEVKDEISLLVSRRRFQYSVGTATVKRPREGDLIFVPLVNGFFEITFVEHEDNQAMMYTLGRGRDANVYLYALKLKKFVFSNEVIDTGVAEIDDNIRDLYPRSQLIFSTYSGTFANDEIIFQSTDGTLANASAQAVVHDWRSTANTVDIIRVQGTFSASSNTIGNTSGAYATTNSDGQDDDAFMNDAFEDIQDNKRIETEADAIIDFSESNPFGDA